MARSWDTTEYTTNEWRSWRVSGATPAQVEAIVVGRMMMMMMMMMMLLLLRLLLVLVS